MKKTILILFSSFCFLALVQASGLSFVDAAATPPATLRLDIEVPLLLPNSPFYFLKTIWENVNLFLAFSRPRKIDLHFTLSGNRLKEALALGRQGKIDLVEKLLESALSHMEAAFGIYKRIEGSQGGVNLQNRFREEVEHQTFLLDEVLRRLEGTPSEAGVILREFSRKKLEELASEIEKYGREGKKGPVFISPLASPSADTYW